MLNITHKKSKDGQRVYAEIGSISAMPKGFVCPNQINDSFIFTYDDFDNETFMNLPEFLRLKMVTSVEFKKIQGIEHEENSDTNNDDDLPF